jgi:hypothetical protein
LVPTPVFYYNEVESVIFSSFICQETHSATRREDSNVTVQFIPKLRAYVTSSFQENEILKGEIHSPLVWEIDPSLLPETTRWNFTLDLATGQYMIDQVE